MAFLRIVAAAALALGASGTAASAERARGERAAASGAAAAQAGLQAQMAAWNRGDLEAALAAYWDSPKMIWVSKKGVERGFAAFAAAMRADFADRSKMGTYSAELLDSRDLGPGAGLIVFRWRIERDGKRLMGGVSTQVWRKAGGGWKVVLEHAG
jgi:ketosteroid isomerase-like protein